MSRGHSVFILACICLQQEVYWMSLLLTYSGIA